MNRRQEVYRQWRERWIAQGMQNGKVSGNGLRAGMPSANCETLASKSKAKIPALCLMKATLVQMAYCPAVQGLEAGFGAIIEAIRKLARG
jgi:hypothetical protein